MKPRGLVSILRHGDRIPKFKLKITSSNNSLFKIFAGILDRDVELKEYNRREEELRDFVLRPEYSVGRAEEIATTISSILTEIGYDLMELETAPLLTESIDTSYDSPSSSSAECDGALKRVTVALYERKFASILPWFVMGFPSNCHP